MNNLAGGSGPSHDRSMEARLAVLEEIAATQKQGMADMRHEMRETNRRIDGTHKRIDELRDALERDFRLLFGAIITVAIGLAALMAKGFHWL